MCVPLLAVAVVATVAAAGVAAYSSYQSGKAQQYAAEYQAQVDRNNAKLADLQGQDALRRGELEKQALQRKFALARAEGRNAFASGNVALGSGAPEAWETSLAITQQQDVAQVEHNARLDAWGARVQAGSLRANALARSAEGRNARMAGNLGAGQSLLSGTGQAAGLGLRAS